MLLVRCLIFRRKRDKSAERKARKAEKRRLREEEEARQVAELSVYSATDNPFHDANLGQQFRWHKKAEKEKKRARKEEKRLLKQAKDSEKRAKRSEPEDGTDAVEDVAVVIDGQDEVGTRGVKRR